MTHLGSNKLDMLLLLYQEVTRGFAFFKCRARRPFVCLQGGITVENVAAALFPIDVVMSLFLLLFVNSTLVTETTTSHVNTAPLAT